MEFNNKNAKIAPLVKPEYRQLSKGELESYKGRLVNALLDNGVDTQMVNSNAEYKNYIAKYTEDNIIKTERNSHLILLDKDKKEHVSYKLVNMDISSKNTITDEVHNRSFPIINKYKGRTLLGSIYFALDKDNVITHRYISMLEKILDISNTI